MFDGFSLFVPSCFCPKIPMASATYPVIAPFVKKWREFFGNKKKTKLRSHVLRPVFSSALSLWGLRCVPQLCALEFRSYFYSEQDNWFLAHWIDTGQCRIFSNSRRPEEEKVRNLHHSTSKRGLFGYRMRRYCSDTSADHAPFSDF